MSTLNGVPSSFASPMPPMFMVTSCAQLVRYGSICSRGGGGSGSVCVGWYRFCTHGGWMFSYKQLHVYAKRVTKSIVPSRRTGRDHRYRCDVPYRSHTGYLGSGGRG